MLDELEGAAGPGQDPGPAHPPAAREDDPMKITFKLYASLGQYLPAEGREGNAVEIEVAPDAAIADVIAPYNLPMKLVHLVLVNGHFVPPEQRGSHRLKDGDALAIWPPIAGG